jgi:hypothetical protein
VYGKNSKKQEEDILEEELKNELNKYILEKLEKHNDLDDYPIFDYIKNGVIGKLMGNFDKELLFKKAFQNTNNKYPEKIVFQGGKRIYNKDDIKRKENACEISTTKEIKNHLDLLLHRIIYFYYKYMHTIQEPDTDDALKKSAPFNYRIKFRFLTILVDSTPSFFKCCSIISISFRNRQCMFKKFFHFIMRCKIK